MQEIIFKNRIVIVSELADTLIIELCARCACESNVQQNLTIIQTNSCFD